MDSYEKKIGAVLQRMRCCIDRKSFTFLDPFTNKERDKNLDFIQTYNVDTKVRLAILKSLTTKNFSEEQYDRVKEDPPYEKSLYVFGKRRVLEQRADGKKKNVLIYIKIQFFALVDGCDATLEISFHEAENDMQFMF